MNFVIWAGEIIAPIGVAMQRRGGFQRKGAKGQRRKGVMRPKVAKDRVYKRIGCETATAPVLASTSTWPMGPYGSWDRAVT